MFPWFWPSSVRGPHRRSAARRNAGVLCRQSVGYGESMQDVRIAGAVLLAMSAFAGNSILCRLALGEDSIDGASFTLIRIASGAALLAMLAGALKRPPGTRMEGDWPSAVMLFVYALAFSYAYINLSAASGALVLFGTVQVTMIVAGLWYGERTQPMEWLGVGIAVSGLLLLELPGAATPSVAGSVLMAVAGVSWGIYSLRGRGSMAALAVTAGNFVRAAPLAVVAGFIMQGHLHMSWGGVLLAVLSGTVTSGIGYAIWYYAVRQLSATQAATVQLSVPVLTAMGGVVFLGEAIGLRTAISGAAILGGVGLSLLGRWTLETGNRS